MSMIETISKNNAPTDPEILRLGTVFEKQKAACQEQRIPDAYLRKDRLSRLRGAIQSHQHEIVAAISEDFGGRSRMETRMLEIAIVTDGIRHALKSLKGWMKAQRRHVDVTYWPHRAYVRHEPKGVVGIIAPWNYPLAMALNPLVDALAAGNRAIIKPSELSPATSSLIAKMIGEAFDESEVAVINGGADVAAHFTSMQWDHLFFTGSTNIGRKVAEAAASNLVPTTLELGGKSPSILCRDYPVARAAESLAFGKFMNAGQTCVAPDYVLAPTGTASHLVDEIRKVVHEAYPDISAEHYSAIISDRHKSRLDAMISQAEEMGATVHRLAQTAPGKVAPTLVTNLPPNCMLLEEEIFGPLLPILEYETLDDAISMTTGMDRPLALYAFTNDTQSKERILSSMPSGGVTVNGTCLHATQHGLPFGGVGGSGWGSYHGVDGFQEFSHARGILEIRGPNIIEKITMPWGALADRVTTFLIKR